MVVHPGQEFNLGWRDGNLACNPVDYPDIIIIREMLKVIN